MNWLEKQVRHTALKQIGFALILLAIVAGGLFGNMRYLTNYFSGPYDIPHAEVIGASDPNRLARYWVNIKPDRMIDTKIDHVTVRTRRGVETGRSVTGRYWAAQLGSKLLIVKAQPEHTAESPLSGHLKAMPDDFRRRVDAAASSDAVRSAMLPMMLDTERFESSAEIGLFVAAATTLGALYMLLRAFRNMSSPAGHPALQVLSARSGESIASASQSIDADLKGGHAVAMKGYDLTTRYLVKTGGAKFDVAPLANLLWAFQITTTKRLWGIIPTGKSYSIALNFTDKTLTVKDREARTLDALRHLSYVAPWVYLGYSDELAAAYKKQRPTLIAHVAERFQASQAAAQASSPNPVAKA